MSSEKQPCIECGAEILATTAARTGGKCMPCARGTRADMERSKAWEAEHRRLRKVNDEARERILTRQRPTLGDFLEEEDPLGVLWPVVVDAAYSGRDRTANIAALSAEARVIYLVQVLDGEVWNGGFDQYFSNSSGDHAHETQQALLDIGALCRSRLLARAIGAFPDARVPIDRATRYEQLNVASEQRSGFFDGLDKEFYALTNGNSATEALGELLLSFMRKNIDAPITPDS